MKSISKQLAVGDRGVAGGGGLAGADFATLRFGGDGWRLTADRAALALPQTAAALVIGNGFIGLRGPGGVDGEGKLYLNGVYARVPIPYHEAAYGYARESDTRLAAADPTELVIAIDGRPLTDWDAAELDLAAGRLRLSAVRDGVSITLDRLVAMDRNIVATRVTAWARRAATITIEPRLAPPPTATAPLADTPYDPRIAPVLGRSPWCELTATADARVDRLGGSGWTVASAIVGGGTIAVTPDDPASHEVMAAIVAAPSGTGLDQAARALAAAAHETGFARLAETQAAWFAAFWRGVELDFPDDPTAARAVRHGLFQLVQAAGRDGTTSLAAKGQTGEGYEGHVFWDAESYAVPALVHLAPATARAMLTWRIAGLPAARENARAMGQRRGALYPWRTIGGRECSSFFPAGSAQYHINADIACALQLYVAATGDRSILDEGGAEMLAETARIWLEIGFHDPRRGDAFVINRVTGPDEYSAIVDNNLYTNLMAAAHLRFAAEAAGAWLDPAEGAAMRRAAAAMLLPYDADRDIPAQDDRFFALEPWPVDETPADRFPLLLHYHPLTIYRHRVAKQADAVLAAALLPDAFDRATRARMLDAYEAVTVHDSTLSASAFAVLAASVGDADRAYRYWRMSVLTDLGDLFANSSHGLHMAALAGGWNALAYGFAGMQVVAGLRFAPIAIPALGRYAFAVAYLGCRLSIAVDADTVRYTLREGERIAFRHRDEAITLSADAPTIQRPLA